MSGPSRGLSVGPPSGRLWLTIERACRPFGHWFIYAILLCAVCPAGARGRGAEDCANLNGQTAVRSRAPYPSGGGDLAPKLIQFSAFAPAVGFARMGGGSDGNWRVAFDIAIQRHSQIDQLGQGYT